MGKLTPETLQRSLKSVAKPPPPNSPTPRDKRSFQSSITMAGDQVQELLEAPSEFAKSGIQFMRRCTKPDKAEYLRLCQAVGVGLVIMGAVGYIVKLIHMPLNRVLVGGA